MHQSTHHMLESIPLHLEAIVDISSLALLMVPFIFDTLRWVLLLQNFIMCYAMLSLRTLAYAEDRYIVCDSNDGIV